MDPSDHVVSLAYESVIDPSRWQATLEAFGRLTGAVESSMICYGSDEKTRFVLTGQQLLPPNAAEPFIAYFGRLDPMRKVFRTLPSGACATLTESVSSNEQSRNEFVQDFLLPNGGGFFGGWNFAVDAHGSQAGLALHTVKRPLLTEELADFAEVARHLGRAITLSIRLMTATSQIDCLEKCLEHEGLQFILVDSSARIVGLSDGANAFLAKRLGFGCTSDHKIAASSHAATQSLHRLIARAAQGEDGGLLRLTPDAGGRTTLANITPYKAPGALMAAEPCALILFRTRSRPTRPDAKRLRLALGCTVAEAEVAAVLGTGEPPVKIAARRGVGLATIRSQIRSLMAITETRRLTELVIAILAVY